MMNLQPAASAATVHTSLSSATPMLGRKGGAWLKDAHEAGAPTPTIRRAGPADAAEISALFRLVYGTSSHPFQHAETVARFSADARNIQVVAEHDGAIVATMAMTYYPWNQSYEWGRGVTHPDARRHGLAEALSQMVITLARQAGIGDLFFGYPRVQRIFDLSASLQPAFVPVGDDGSRNVANGKRETHLFVCAVPPECRFAHRSPANRERCAFVCESIYRPLGLRPKPGSYPTRAIVGAASPTTRRAFGLDLEYDAGSPDRALEIVADHRRAATAHSVADRIASAVDRLPGVEHVSITILADKTALLDELVSRGFECSAYLPAWFRRGQVRYDCVQLVKTLYSVPPVVSQFDAVVQKLRTELEAVVPVHENDDAPRQNRVSL